ncbi:TetR/AcrR family transcriptional regulator [Compostibacter hankyongensis]|uniref:TetR family transcriptional regulator n=1 Tax=Compostibacter hankyongensis TaxID=1007089 RepID=A0ABP8FTP6_9BACT
MEWSEKQLQILEVAEELFAEKSYEGTSVRDIAQKAEVNIAMISYYFGSKEKLLEALIEYRASYAAGVVDELEKKGITDPQRKMDRLIDFYVERILVNHRFHNIMSRQLSMISEEKLRNKMIDIKQKNMELVRKVILEGQRKKVFRKVDVDLTMATITGTISQVTLAKGYYCKLMNAEDLEFSEYISKMKTRVKTHLKQLIGAHLDIKNA